MAQNSIQQIISRTQPNFHPSLWGDIFCTIDEHKQMQLKEAYAKEIQELKETTKKMLTFQKDGNVLDYMILIDTIERLGLSYHFEKEIEDQLQQIYAKESYNEVYNDKDEDLYFVSLHFRLLRQHGYKIFSGVFSKFKKTDGRFNENLKDDIRGLLALYEASYWRAHGEDILKEALEFTTPLLKLFVDQSSSKGSLLAKQVAHALSQPLHRGIPRVETFNFIFLYEKSDMKNNDILLRFAKLDFNMSQMIHKKELYELSRWWKTLDVISKLEYPRDRLVEGYFWALGVFPEPHFSITRIISTKIIMMISIIDDTCDAHATLEEVDIFNSAVKSWNYSEIDRLPEYMKIVYTLLLDLFEDFIQQFKTREELKYLIVNHIQEGMKQLVGGYLTEMQWFMKEYFPTFNDYLSNGLITSVYNVLVPAFCLRTFLSDDMTNTEAYEVCSWLSENTKFLQACATIGRLDDDLASFEREKEMGQVVTGIECYMKEYNVSKEEAFNKFREITENAWKDINEGCFKPTKVTSSIIASVVNLCRTTDFVYKDEQDTYTDPAKILKPLIISLLIEPILI